MTWWQVGLLKLYVFVVGLMLGAYFADVVNGWYVPLLIIFGVLMVYFLYAMFTDGFKAKAAGDTDSA
jgi:hypothetical protein